MKQPKDKEEYFELIKKQPYLLLVIGLLLFLFSYLIKVIGIGLIIGGGIYCFYKYYKENKKKEKKKDEPNM